MGEVEGEGLFGCAKREAGSRAHGQRGGGSLTSFQGEGLTASKAWREKVECFGRSLRKKGGGKGGGKERGKKTRLGRWG